jgi:hypothetical protein
MSDGVGSKCRGVQEEFTSALPLQSYISKPIACADTSRVRVANSSHLRHGDTRGGPVSQRQTRCDACIPMRFLLGDRACQREPSENSDERNSASNHETHDSQREQSMKDELIQMEKFLEAIQKCIYIFIEQHTRRSCSSLALVRKSLNQNKPSLPLLGQQRCPYWRTGSQEHGGYHVLRLVSVAYHEAQHNTKSLPSSGRMIYSPRQPSRHYRSKGGGWTLA